MSACCTSPSTLNGCGPVFGGERGEPPIEVRQKIDRLPGRHAAALLDLPVAPFTRDGILIGLRSDPGVHTGERLAFVAWEWADRSTASH